MLGYPMDQAARRMVQKRHVATVGYSKKSKFIFFNLDYEMALCSHQAV